MMNVRSTAAPKRGRRYTYALAHHLQMNRLKATRFRGLRHCPPAGITFGMLRLAAYHRTIIDGGLVTC